MRIVDRFFKPDHEMTASTQDTLTVTGLFAAVTSVALGILGSLTWPVAVGCATLGLMIVAGGECKIRGLTVLPTIIFVGALIANGVIRPPQIRVNLTSILKLAGEML